MQRIYLDNAASTSLYPDVYQAMFSWTAMNFGNPSSQHQEGRTARAEIDKAREILAKEFGCLFGEVLFTSSGTEAANTAIIGTALENKNLGRKRVLLGASEHHCVLNCAEILYQLGYEVVILPVDSEARIDINGFKSFLGSDVLLASIMHVNNETGAINPTVELVKMAHEHGILFHSDAVQAFAQPINPEGKRWKVSDLGADLISVSAHKIHGPKGIGALYIKSGTKIRSVLVGGGQERDLRAGTENISGIIGFAKAVELSWNDENLWQKKRYLRHKFLETLEKKCKRQYIFTTKRSENVMPGFLHMRFPGLKAESVLIRLDRAGICASSGAACSSGSFEPSHVLLACSLTKEEAKEGLRFTFSKMTTEEEAIRGAEIVAQVVNEMPNEDNS